MKRSFTSIIFFGLCNLLSPAAYSQVYNLKWDKTFGGDSRDWNTQVKAGNNGHLYIVGDSQSRNTGNKTVDKCNPLNGNSDIWISRIDTSGNILWQKDLGGEADERYPKLFFPNSPANEILMICYSSSDTACDKTENNRDTIPLLSTDFWVCKIDSSGTLLWDKTIGGDNYDDYPQLSSTALGNLLIAGESNSPVSGDKTVANYAISNDIWVMMTSNNGTLLWDKVYGNDGAEYLTDVIALPNGGFLLGGSTASDQGNDVSQTTRGGIDYWIIRIDENGNKIWDKRFGGSGTDRCSHVARTNDNGFILSGFTTSPISGEVSQAPKGTQDYWVVKTDSSGNLLWEKRYGGTAGSFATWAEDAPGGGYWVSGYTSSGVMSDVSQPSYGGSDYWVLKVDNVGTKLFDKRFGGSSDEFATSFEVLPDSSVLLFGYSDTGYSAVKSATNYGWYDYWMVKFHYRDIFSGINENASIIEAGIYPNPTTGIFNVVLTSFSEREISYYVTDISGRIISGGIEKPISSSYSFVVDLSNEATGQYFVHLKSDISNKVLKINKL